MIVFGGEVYRGDDYVNEIWSLSLVDSIEWSFISTAGEVPAGRIEHSAVYDPARDRMIVFGGRNRTTRFNDVWALSLSDSPAWKQIEPQGPAPSPRSGHVAVFDAASDRMIVFAGSDGDTLNEVWELTFTPDLVWRQLSTRGEAPARFRPTGTLDPMERRLIVFGGMGIGAEITDEVWSLDLDSMAWSRLDPPGSWPSPRYRHAETYDSARGRLIVFGGSDPNRENDLWALDLGGSPEWTELIDLGTPSPHRFGHAMAYDPVGDQMIVFGGATGGSGSWRNDIRALNLSGNMKWHGIDAAGPVPATTGHSLIYDPVRHRLVSFGGFSDVLQSRTNETWVLSLSEEPHTWILLQPQGTVPHRRDSHSAVYDPIRDRMIIFGGGYGQPVHLLDDVWSLTLSDPPTWTELHPVGPGPSARGHQMAVYDPLRDRMLMYDGGGWQDVWSLSLAGPLTWSQLAPAGDPPPQYPYGVIYDPIRDRIVVHDDVDDTASPTTNVWELSLSGAPTWKRLAPSGPLLVGFHSNRRRAIYDPRRDRLIAFSAWDWPDGGSDTWTLTWGHPIRPGLSAEIPEWSGGPVARTTLSVTNPLPEARVVELKVTTDRGWPGLPPRGWLEIAGSSTKNLVIRVPVPDTAHVAHAHVRFSAAYAGATGNDTILEKEIVDATTAVLASLVSAEAGPDNARLLWHVATQSPVTIQRRDPATLWVAFGEVTPEGGLVRFEDRDVRGGARYGYRLQWTGSTGRVSAGEAWLDIPQTPGLNLLGARPNPTKNDLSIAFTTPEQGPAKLELFDIGGRRVAIAEPGRLAPGFHVIPLARSTELGPGVYIVRLGFAGKTLKTRAVVVR